MRERNEKGAEQGTQQGAGGQGAEVAKAKWEVGRAGRPGGADDLKWFRE